MVAGAALGAAESFFVREGIQQGPSVTVVFVIFLLDLAIGVLLGGASGLLLAYLIAKKPQDRPFAVVPAFFTAFFTAGLLFLFLNARPLARALPTILLAKMGLSNMAYLIPVGYLLISIILGYVFFLSLMRISKRTALPTYTAEVAVWCVLLAGIPHFVSWPSISTGPLIAFIAGGFLVYCAVLKIFRRFGPPSAITFESTVRWKAVGIFVIACSFLTIGSSRLYGPGQSMHTDKIARIMDTNQTREQFNVLLVVLDTLRADHMSIYGYERKTTPSIDRLAADSVVFRFALSTSSWTLPAHASLFTGLFPSAHGARLTPESAQLASGLAPSCTTLAETLRNCGYATGCISANFGLVSPELGLDQGFQHFDNRPHFYGMRMSFTLQSRCFAGVGSGWFAYLTKATRPAEEISDLAVQWLDKEGGTPFFLFLNYMDPHAPYLPPPRFDALFPGGAHPTLLDRVEPSILKMERDITDEERASLISSYDGEIAYLDFHLGRLLTGLKQRGLYEKTMIIVTSDHGEYFGEHNLLRHHRGLHQEVLWIPLLVKYPNSQLVGQHDGPVQILDIMPTVLSTLGLPIPDSIQGDRLGAVDHEIIAEHWAWPDDVARFGSRFDRNVKAVFCDGMKYIRCSDGKDELYNLQDNPRETNNLIAVEDRLAKEMAERLAYWEASTAHLASPGRSVTVGEELKEKMRALGYLAR